MSLRNFGLTTGALVLASCWSDWDNSWDKVGRYTCKVQEWASSALTDPKIISVWNQSFTTDPDIISRFDNRTTDFRLPNTFNENWGLEIYFITNQSALDNWDKSDLDQIAEQINNAWEDVTVLLEWHADARWSISANERMAQRRIESVEQYLRSRVSPNIHVTYEFASFWETDSQAIPQNPTHDELLQLRPDRRVVVNIAWSTIESGLDRSPADAYILDASSSMSWTRWNTVSQYKYPDDASIYTFTDNQKNFDDDDCANSLSEQRVIGQTPLLISIMDVIQTWEYDNKVITVLSDWWNNVWLLSSAEIIWEAQNRWIIVNVIWIWSADTVLLRNIAKETGGTYTFER